MSNKIKENTFDAAPGGNSGTLNYQSSIGTHSSPNTYQNPSKFGAFGTNKYYDTNSTGQPDTQISDTSGSFDKDVDSLFKKKKKPTADDVMAGIQYEMQKMLHKDVRLAKQLVVANLKKFGPDYYTGLKMMGIDDGESDIVSESKIKDDFMKRRVQIMDEFVKTKQERRKDTKMNSFIQKILDDKMAQKTEKMDYLINKR